jgi:2-polyprenyl-3-methyl-5-hydroxy-6-metoxy-1,4-benzoquinol methylase
MKPLLDYKNPGSYVNRLRRRRHECFTARVQGLLCDHPVRILDVGGTFHYWKTMGVLDGRQLIITLINLRKEMIPAGLKNMRSLEGDVRSQVFDISCYDVIFSNSVIEHLGSKAAMREFADRIRQGGKPYYIQTPSKWFPLEPHSRLPFFQFFPRPLRAWLIWRFKINYFPRGETYRDCLTVSDSTIMLSKREVRSLFPESEIVTERLFGMPKSYTAIHGFPTAMKRPR